MAIRHEQPSEGEEQPFGAHGAGLASSRESDAAHAAAPVLDPEVCYRALRSRDARFDGWFFPGVTSTGIYCRPSCPSILPRRDRLHYYPTSAAAQRAGFRACKRCRPDTAPGSPEWNRRGDVVARAMRSINDGVVDREGVSGLARQLGYSARQLQRLMVAEVGAGPLELARAQRAETARLLLETTDLRIGEVAFAAGFGSVRQFNETVRAIFDEAPLEMRERACRSRPAGPVSSPAWRVAGSTGHAPRRPRAGGAPALGNGALSTAPVPASMGGTVCVSVRLPFRRPLPAGVLFTFLAERAVPGLEDGDSTWYRRVLSLTHGAVVVTITAEGDTALRCHLQLDDLRDLATAVGRVRRLFDLDADPVAVADVLGSDPVLGAAVAELPGLRIPGHVDGDELAVRAVLGQQVSVSGARTLAGRLVLEHGRPLAAPIGTVVGEFPGAQVIAGLSPDDLPMPGARARALIGLCGALSSGRLALHPGADREAASRQLLELPGIGPWTVAYVRMRALSDPDAFLAGDLGVKKALARLGLPADERSAAATSEQWRPYRAYALQYLWSGLPPSGSPAGSPNYPNSRSAR
jgi:AraC family transcriptional regulator of adaptative response / DNA-3-methyladenine glycosylase II